jgi:hypothetical protein
LVVYSHLPSGGVVEELTTIQRLGFVEGGAQGRYLGMASPRAVRKALARSCGVNLDCVYREVDEKSERR